jgi:hypothetical protein
MKGMHLDAGVGNLLGGLLVRVVEKLIWCGSGFHCKLRIENCKMGTNRAVCLRMKYDLPD